MLKHFAIVLSANALAYGLYIGVLGTIVAHAIFTNSA
jgi:hypothetical protein